jgi:uncharacterized membrane protein
MTENKEQIVGQGQQDPNPKPTLNANLQNLTGVDDVTSVNLCYGLYLSSFVFVFTSIGGLILAYVKRSEAEEWLQSHYTYLIRTFWISFLYCVIGIVTSILVIGILILIATAILWIARVIVGWNYAYNKKPIPNPTTWLV